MPSGRRPGWLDMKKWFGLVEEGLESVTGTAGRTVRKGFLIFVLDYLQLVY